MLIGKKCASLPEDTFHHEQHVGLAIVGKLECESTAADADAAVEWDTHLAIPVHTSLKAGLVIGTQRSARICYTFVEALVSDGLHIGIGSADSSPQVMSDSIFARSSTQKLTPVGVKQLD